MALIWQYQPEQLARVLVAGRFDFFGQGFNHSWPAKGNHSVHQHLYHARARFGDREIELQPGDITILPAGTYRSYDMEEPSEHYCLKFEPITFELDQDGSLVLPMHVRSGSQAESFTRHLQEVIQLHQSSRFDELAAAASRASLQHLLLRLAVVQKQQEKEQSQGARSVRAVSEAARLIEQQLDRPLFVKELAFRVGLSQNYLARLFKQTHGQTLHQYQLARRVDYAQHLLTTTCMPVQEIGAKVGIPDAQEFNKACRRVLHLSPTAIRRHG